MRPFAEVKERARQRNSAALNQGKSADWEELKARARKNILASSPNADQDISNWFDGLNQLGQRAYEYYGTEGYRAPDTDMEKEIDRYLSQAGGIKSLISASRDKYADYESVLKSYDDAYSYLTELKNGIPQSNAFYAQFTPTEEQAAEGVTAESLYDQWRTDYATRQKYEGLTYQQIRDKLNIMPKDSEDYQWLTEYAPTVMTTEDYDTEIKATDAEITNLEAVLAEYKKLTKQVSTANPDAYANVRLAELRKQYGSSADIQGQLEQLKATRLQYENDRKYKIIPGNEDFAENSGYVSTATEDWWSKATSQFNLGYSDLTYEYVNNQDDIRDTVRRAAVNTNYGLENYDRYDHLEPEEVAIYNYLYSTQGKEAAAEYLKSLEQTLNARNMDAYAKDVADFAGKNFWTGLGASVASVPANLLSGAGYLNLLGQKAVKGIKEAVTGEYAGPIDYNTPAMRMSVGSTTARSTVAQKIADNTGVINFNPEEHPMLSRLLNGKSLGDVYQLGMSMADSTATAVLSMAGLGAGATLLLGGSAATQTTLEAAANGATDEQALTMGALSGAFEYLFEKYELENLIGNVNDGVLKALFKQSLSEGFGEGMTSVANLAADSLIMADKSEISRLAAQYMAENPSLTEGEAWAEAMKDIAIGIGWDAVGGMAMGGIMGGIGAAVNKVVSKVTDPRNDALMKLAMEKIDAEQQGQDMENTAPEDGVKYSIKRTQNMSWEEQISGALSRGENIGRNDTLVLDDTPATLVNDGVEGKKLAIPLSVITKAKSGKDASHSIKDTNLKDLQRGVRNAPIMINNPVRNAIVFVTDIKQDGAPVLLAFQKNTEFDGDTVHKATSIHLQMDVASMLKALPSEATVYAKNESELDTAVGVADNLRSLAANVKFTVDSVAENVAGVNVEITHTDGKILRGKDAVEVADIATAGGGKVSVTLTDGSTADVSELSFRDVGEQELWRVIAEYAESAEAARQLLKEYRAGSMDAYAYARGAEEAMLYGRANISEKEMEVRGSYVNQMDPMQRNMAYTLGRIAGEKRTRQRQAEAAERNTKRQRKGSVNYGYEGQALDKSKLTKAQRVGVDFAERLARKKGMTFYFYRSWTQNGQKVYRNQKGQIVAADKNGWYDPGDGSIHIDLNCGDMGGTVLFTLAHELTHFIQDWSPAKYRTLCGIITEGYLDMGQSVEELILNKQEEYKAKGESLTYEEAFDEVIASSMEGVLSNGRVMELLDEIETKDKTLYEKVRSFIEDVAALIHETIQAYRDLKPDSPEGRIVQRMQGIHEQLQKVFAEGLHEGGENYRQGGKENTTPEGGIRNSIVALDNGNVYVQASRNIITGTTKAQQRQNITDFFNALLDGKGSLDIHTIEGDVLTITKRETATKARDDYKSVNGKAVPMTSDEFAVKMRVEAHIDEIAEVSNAPKNSKLTPDTKSHNFAKSGFSYRKAYFEDFDGSYYEVTLSIGHSGTVATVYNVGKIDKSTLPSAKIIAVVGSQPLGKVLSVNSIRSSQQKVNKNSVRYQKNAAAREHLEKENASMGEDVAGLNELVAAMRRQGNRGNLQKSTLDAAASVLMEKAGARGKKTELMELLDTFYQYIGNGEDLSWDGIRQAAQPAVNWLMDHVARGRQVSQYAREVLNEVRTSRVCLDETQKGEAAHRFGSYEAFRKALMGSVTIAGEGAVSLDSQWHEWAQLYPDVFREDVSAADMPGELVDIINRMRNTDTSELEFEYNRELMEQELLYRIYGSYWNASTLYIVAGQHEAQIRQLKGKHNQRMNEVYQRHRDMEEKQRQTHRQRQEAARFHYEEQYQKREAEYRESRRKAVERHDMAELRQRIRKDVQRLDSLLNKGSKKKNVKEGLREVVGAALRLAKGSFLQDYNEYDMLRSGVGVSMTRENREIFEYCRELLQELDQIRREKEQQGKQIRLKGFDPEQAMRRDDREEALKKELSKNMAILRRAEIFKAERETAEDATAEALADELLGAYQKLADTEYEHLQGAYSDKVYGQIKTVRDQLSGKAIKDMTSVELRELQKLYRMISETVSRADELFGAYRNEKISKGGNRILDQLKTKRDADITAAVNKLKAFGWSLLTPDAAAEIIGSEELTRRIHDVMAGELVQQEDLEHARQFAEETAEKFNRKKWDASRQVKFAGTEITIGQAMALFAYTERKAGRDHLSGDGFTHSKEVPIKQKLGKLKISAKFIKDTTRAYRVTEDMYSKLEQLLTEDQKGYARAMRDYLAQVMGAKGNEVSMELYGIEMYGEKFYFPLKSAKEFMEAALGARHGEKKLTNSGFTNALQEGASNAIVLEDFETVWAKHVQEMSNYHALAVPMENFNRLYNYRKTETRQTVDKQGQLVTGEVRSKESVSLHIERRATGGSEYLVKWMESVNGGVRSDATEQLLGGALGNFRKTSVLGNLSVIFQQPTAILRAAPYLGKDFGSGWLTYKRTTPDKGLLREMYRYCPVAGLKKMGGFDPSTGRTARQYLLNGRDDGKGKIRKGIDRFNEGLGMAPEKMDELAWSYLWLCCKKKTLRENQSLRAGSKEHCQVAAELFTKIVRETQVYDSVMSKPLIMQSKNMVTKGLTSFMNEPLKGLNQCILAVTRAKNGEISKLEAAENILFVSASDLLARAVSSLIYALRDDDDEKTYWEKYRSAFAGSLLDWINPFSRIPGIKEFFSIAKGYGSERSEFVIVSDVWSGIQKLFQESKAETPEEIEKEVWDRLELGLGNVLNGFGIPGRNLIREIRGIYYRVKQWGDVEGTNAGARYAVLEGLTGKATSKKIQLGNATAEDDAEHLLRVMGTYDDPKDAVSALVSGIREAWIGGRVSDDRATEYLQEYGGKSLEEVADYLAQWEFKKAYPKSELTDSKAENYIQLAEPAGIDIETYSRFVAETKDLEADKDSSGNTIPNSKREKVWKVINGLPLSRLQKDALHYSYGYEEGSLEDAPWN